MWGRRRGVVVDVVFETHPGDEGGAEGEVEESFVGNGEDDEDGRKGQEDDDESVEIVVIWVETVEERNRQGGNCHDVSMYPASHSNTNVLRTQYDPSDHLITQWQACFSL